MVAFCRTMKPGMRGNDVRAAKRAVSRFNPQAFPWRGFTNYFGPEFEKAVKKFQARKSLKQTGILDKASVEALSASKNQKGEPCYDALALELAADFCHDFKQNLLRSKIVDAGFFWYAHRSAIAYSQARPFQVRQPPRVPQRWDCSAFVTNCYYGGGAQNPNGRSWDGLGYTGTLISHGTRLHSIVEAHPGDLIFYGSSPGGKPGFRKGDPTHVALFVGQVKGVASVLSHGSYPMHLLRWDYRAVNQIRRYI